MWKNNVNLGRPQMTVWRMCTACWIPKATNTHSEYVKTFFIDTNLIHNFLFKLHKITYVILCNLYKKLCIQVGINKGIILRCTAYQISRCKNLLLFRCNNGCKNALQCYVICTLPVLLSWFLNDSSHCLYTFHLHISSYFILSFEKYQKFWWKVYISSIFIITTMASVAYMLGEFCPACYKVKWHSKALLIHTCPYILMPAVPRSLAVHLIIFKR